MVKAILAPLDDSTVVDVRRHWNDYVTGTVALRDLRDFHWRRESGGVNKSSPRPMLYARMWCDALIDGGVSHSCRHGEGPHQILVCITKRSNAKIFRQLEQLSRNTKREG